MEIEGVVHRILPVVKGTSARGEWSKQEIIIEMQSEFNRKVCISFWGDKAAEAASLREGERVSVSVNVESREYNGRWFTEVRAWKVSRAAEAAPSAPPMVDLPPITGDFEESSSGGGKDFDDLPF